jgi:hypothetical protein
LPSLPLVSIRVSVPTAHTGPAGVQGTAQKQEHYDQKNPHGQHLSSSITVLLLQITSKILLE